MTNTNIIHLKPNLNYPDGVQDYQHVLISSLNEINYKMEISNRLSFTELKLNELILYKNLNFEQTFIHCQLPMSAWRFNLFLPLVVFIKLINRKYKLVTTLHEWSNTHFLRRMINYFFLSYSYYIIVPSEEIKKEINKFKFITKRNIDIHVIPVGPNILLKNHLELSDKERIRSNYRIGHFGFLYPLKNPNKLLRVFSEITKLKNDSKLIFIGDFLNSKTRDKQHFNEQITKLNLNSNIEFKGYLKSENDVLNEMNKWDIYISLHKNGFSLRHGSTLAALQIGIPVISYEPISIISDIEKNWLNSLLENQNLTFIKMNLSNEEIAKIVIDKLNEKMTKNAISLNWIWTEISKMHINLYTNYMQQ